MTKTQRSKPLFCVLFLLAVPVATLAQTTHYAVNDDGAHILGYQGSPGCNFPLFVMGSGFNPFVGDDSSLTPNTDFTVLSFDTIDWLLNDTYTLFAGEQSRSGQPFQKLGRIMVEAGSSDEPFPASNDPLTPNPMSLVATLTEEEFFSETGIDIGEFVNDLLSAGHGRYLYVRFRFETCSDKDTDPDLIELQKGGSTNPESVRIVQGSSIVELPNKLFFAQFADGNFGDTTLSSQIVLVNPSDLVTAEVRIILNLGSGAPLVANQQVHRVLGQSRSRTSAGLSAHHHHCQEYKKDTSHLGQY